MPDPSAACATWFDHSGHGRPMPCPEPAPWRGEFADGAGRSWQGPACEDTSGSCPQDSERGTRRRGWVGHAAAGSGFRRALRRSPEVSPAHIPWVSRASARAQGSATGQVCVDNPGQAVWSDVEDRTGSVDQEDGVRRMLDQGVEPTRPAKLRLLDKRRHVAGIGN